MFEEMDNQKQGGQNNQQKENSQNVPINELPVTNNNQQNTAQTPSNLEASSKQNNNQSAKPLEDMFAETDQNSQNTPKPSAFQAKESSPQNDIPINNTKHKAQKIFVLIAIIFAFVNNFFFIIFCSLIFNIFF